jgi:site-specific recombinase XerD
MKSESLSDLVENYLEWMHRKGYSTRTINDHRCVMRRFTIFAARKKWSMEAALKPENRADFVRQCAMTKASGAMLGFSGYLESLGLVEKPEPPGKPGNLPDVYASYLARLKKLDRSKEARQKWIRKILGDFNQWLEKRKIRLETLDISQVDAFLKERNQNLAPRSRSDNRGVIRNFLSFLHAEKRILKRDLAPFILSLPDFGRDNPPKYLRKSEICRLFSSIDLSAAEGLRTGVMVRLAYTTGLRPGEIARICMSDIAFAARELTVPERKGDNPIRFPLPDDTVKAMAAYIIGARPETDEDRLFVSLSPPHRPIAGGLVSDAIGKAMKAAGLPGYPYRLRHTYAQNLLESGASIFEIKEMLGHDCIKATKRYLHIHIRLMREVLFDD